MTNYNSKPFSIHDGLKHQREDLKYWKTILKKKYFDKLNAYAGEQNNDLMIEHNGSLDKAYFGYRVARGSDLQNFVANILNKH